MVLNMISEVIAGSTIIFKKPDNRGNFTLALIFSIGPMLIAGLAFLFWVWDHYSTIQKVIIGTGLAAVTAPIWRMFVLDADQRFEIDTSTGIVRLVETHAIRGQRVVRKTSLDLLDQCRIERTTVADGEGGSEQVFKAVLVFTDGSKLELPWIERERRAFGVLETELSRLLKNHRTTPP